MHADQEATRNNTPPGGHYYVYAECGVRCFYCGMDARAIADPDVAFWIYRHFSVDHVVPRRLFPSRPSLEQAVAMRIGRANALRVATALEDFNLVPTCLNCNVLLNAYPARAEQKKRVEAFQNLFFLLPTEASASGSGVVTTGGKKAVENVAAQGQARPPEHAISAYMESILIAFLDVWQDKRGVLITRLEEEREYYSKYYVPKKVGMPALKSLNHPEFPVTLTEAMKTRWRDHVKPHVGVEL